MPNILKRLGHPVSHFKNRSSTVLHCFVLNSTVIEYVKGIATTAE
jgi:hypothetical protein